MLWFGIIGWMLAVTFSLCLGFAVGVYYGAGLEDPHGGDDDDV